MKTIIVLLVVAVISLGLSANMASNSRQVAYPPDLLIPPPVKQSASIIAGSGIIEPLSEEIRIGSPLGGVVVEVHVTEGDDVLAGAPLFRLDDRELTAELATRDAEVAEAEAELERLRALPRPENLAIAQAVQQESLASLELATQREARLAILQEASAASKDAFDEAYASRRQADARLRVAEADLNLVRQGTWQPELRIAEAKLEVLRTRAAQTKVNLERLVVTAPTDCVVLDINVRRGEYVPNGSDSRPLMVVGQRRPFAVRVDIDETDLWRIPEDSMATLFMRGNPQLTARATLLGKEPRVVPKVSLTGARTERIDIRVFQLRYQLDDPTGRFRIGQQVDVHIVPLSQPDNAPGDPSR